jgi:hypothetical protein
MPTPLNEGVVRIEPALYITLSESEREMRVGYYRAMAFWVRVCSIQ